MNWLGESSHRLFLVGALLMTGSAAVPSGKIHEKGRHVAFFRSSAASQVSTGPCVRKIAFCSNRDPNGSYEIYVMNDDGTNQTRLTTHSALDLSPSWSPDGSTIAFQSDRDNLENGRSDIYLMNEDGSNIRRLTTNPAFDEGPVWSPDGNRIAFVSTRDDQNNNIRQLYVMNADGSDQTRLTFGNSVESLAWSPDSSQIAFSSYTGIDPGRDIFTISAGGGPVNRLTTGLSNEGGPAWSPDGSQIAFTFSLEGPGEHSDIHIMNADGTNHRNLTGTPTINEVGAGWSPDGSAIAFVRSPDFGSADIYVMHPDGSAQTRLTDNPAFDVGSAWQPNPAAPPCLLTESGTDRAVALDSVRLTRGPFPVVTDSPFNPDHRTRIMLFARDLKLPWDSEPSAVTAEAEDAQHGVIPLTVEFVGKVPNFEWLTQVNVRLPDELRGGGEIRINIRQNGVASNKPFINIAPDPNSP